MTEKILDLMEKILFRVLFAALAQVDAKYPDRLKRAGDKVLHKQDTDAIWRWYAGHLVCIQKMRLKCQPNRALPSRKSTLKTEAEYDSFLEIISSFLAASWLISTRLMMLKMDFIIEIAEVDANRCLSEMRDLAEDLQSYRRVDAGGKAMVAALVPARTKSQIEAQFLANQFLNDLLNPTTPKPVGSLPSPKHKKEQW